MSALRRLRAFRLSFGIAAGVLAWLSIVSYWNTHALEKSFQRTAQTQDAIEKFQHVEVLLESAGSSVSGYVVSGEADRLNAFQYAKLVIPREMLEIDRLLPVRREKQAARDALDEQLNIRFTELSRIVKLRQTSGQDTASAAIRRETGSARDVMERVLSEVLQDYLAQEGLRAKEAKRRALFAKGVLVLSMILSLLLVGWTYGLLRREAGERDIAESAKGQTEALLKTIIQHIPYMIFLKDARNSRVALVNKTAQTWLGQTEEHLTDALEKDFRSKVEADLSLENERRATSENRIIECEEHLTVAGLPERLLRTLKIPLVDPEGRVVYVLSLSEDITQRKQAERMLELSRDAAVEAVRLRSEFIRNMSHELRTPLSIVIGMASLLRDGDLDAKQKGYVDAIRRSSEGLAGLTKNILDFSRIETGSFALETREMNVIQITEDVVAMMQDQAKAKGVTLVTLASSTVPATVRADPARIRQVLTQLVANAVKFTEKGQVSVRLSVADEKDGSLRLRYQVTDTGIGITEDVQKHLFEPFRQGDGSWTRRYGGTGLGLAMAKRIVELLGGEMGFESASGMGSTFWFTLPVQKRQSSGPMIHMNNMPWTRAHVLLVSENPITRQKIKQQLNDCALSCDSVSSGQAALEVLLGEKKAGRVVSLVLLDMQLADMDAVHLAKVVKNNKTLQDTKMALLLSESATLDDATSTTLGFAGSLRLPCQAEELYEHLARWIDPKEPRRRQHAA